MSGRRERSALPVLAGWRPSRALVRRRRALRPDRLTYALGATALGTVAAVVGTEVARVWRRGSAPLPADAPDVLLAAEEAARETVEVAVEGYRATPPRETALFNVLVSFVITFALARVSTHAIRRRGRFGPFRDMKVGDRHIHHFVPGIVIAFAAGSAAIVTRHEAAEAWLAVPFGAGMALTLDEWALLMQLEDVYWTEEGVISLQVGAGTAALLGALTLARRLLLRGEAEVLESVEPAPAMDRVSHPV